MKDYRNLSLEEIKERIEKNNAKLKEFWEMDTGSWEEYKKLCQPYWDDNNDLYAAESLKIPREEISMRPDDDLDKECRVPIEDFTEWCKSGCVCGSDGVGYYADENEVSFLTARTYAFYHDMIRPDFKYVCWYNK